MEFWKRFEREGGVRAHPRLTGEKAEAFVQRYADQTIMILGWLPINEAKTDWMMVVEQIDVTKGRDRCFNCVGTTDGELMSDFVDPDGVWEFLALARSSPTALSNRLAGVRDMKAGDISFGNGHGLGYVLVPPSQIPALA